MHEAVAIANGKPCGRRPLSRGTDLDAVRPAASRLRAGQVNLNSAPGNLMVPFGGFKLSGKGRECGDHAFGQFLEVKAVLHYAPRTAA